MTAATVSITQIRPRVVVSREGGPSITIQATGRPQVQVRPTGLRGPPGPASVLTAGAGLSIVGNEIRMAIGALPIAG
jgi:hypothetical protein